MASDITTLTADLTTVDGKADSNADALTALTVRVEDNEDGLVAVSQDLTTLTNTITDPETGLSAVGDAVDALEVETAQLADGISTASSSTRALRSAVRGRQARHWRGWHRTRRRSKQTVRSWLRRRRNCAPASTRPMTRCRLCPSRSSLQAAIPGLATAEALQLLSTEVSQQGDVITSQGQAIIALDNDLTTAEGNISGNATAVSGLTTQVDSIEGDVTALAGRTATLEAQVQDPKTERWLGSATSKGRMSMPTARWRR